MNPLRELCSPYKPCKAVGAARAALYYVTTSDKRGMESLGGARDNWRQYHLGDVFINVLFLICVHCRAPIMDIILTVHNLFYLCLNYLKAHFKLQKSNVSTKAV